MRVSLLLEREPFAEIVCATLARYWQARTGHTHFIEWHDHNPGLRELHRQGVQAWFGNIFLNCFAVRYAPEEAFLPLRNEYLRSVSFWRRWPQAAYVHLALLPAFRQRFAQVAFSVWPGVYDAHDCIVLGGNRRLRLLHPRRQATTVLLKDGFARNYLADEARTRLALGAKLACAPQIRRHSINEGWYEEEIVRGTPLNRIDEKIQHAVIEQCHGMLARQLVEPTLAQIDLGSYLDGITERIRAVVHPTTGLAAPIYELERRLRELLLTDMRRSDAIQIAATHGDLQPANLLWDDGRVHVIDWENARHRTVTYDPLFYTIGMTTTARWSTRFIRLLHSPGKDLPPHLRSWPGLEWHGRGAWRTLAIFLLEQLATIAEEDFDPRYYQPGTTFRQRLSEFEKSAEALRQ